MLEDIKANWKFLVVYAIILVALWFIFFYKKKEVKTSESGFINCKPGTCPGQHTTGEWWCSSAFCKHSDSTSVASTSRVKK